MDKTYTGQKISALRKAKGWTQKELAELVFVSVAAVSKWERGLNYPDLALIEPLADVLGVTAAELLGLASAAPDDVIRDMTVISADQRQEERKRVRRVLATVGISVGIFLFASFAFLLLLSRDGLLLSLLGWGRGGILDFAALLLGLAAWGFALCSVFSQKRKEYIAAAFAFCATALYLPLLLSDLSVRAGEIGTVIDTVAGYHFGAALLLGGTLLLSICALWLHRGRRSGGK